MKFGVNGIAGNNSVGVELLFPFVSVPSG